MKWQMLDELPDGWQFDKTVGSPVHGYVFATDGKSVIHGQKRALVRTSKKEMPTANPVPLPTKKRVEAVEEAPPKLVNELARKRFELRLLADIRLDLSVCEIEGWSKTEYIDELCELLNSIRKEIK